MKIGVDGGGTKTELILIDTNGAQAGRILAPGCNPSVVGQDRAREILTTALNQLTAPVAAGTITHTLLCMAGSQDFWKSTGASLSGFGCVEAMSDAMPVLELATDGQPGLVLHAGTGSFVALRSPDQTVHFAAGFGWRLGDPGSAQDIGRRCLTRAVAELQGWAPPSGLGALAAATFGTKDPGTITGDLHRHQEPNQVIGAFAAKASALACDGDPVARALVIEAAVELLHCAEDAATAFFGKTTNIASFPSGLSGTILTQSFVAEALQSKTTLHLTLVKGLPIEGVRQMLGRLR